MEINGKKYATVKDVLGEFGVSAKAVNEWITKGIIPRPPQIEHGTRKINHFPSEYMARAKASLKAYLARKEAKKKNSGKTTP